MFQKYKSLEKHIDIGKCQLRVERESLFDRAKIKYHEKLEIQTSAAPNLQPTHTEKTGSAHQPLKRGWALKATKKNTRFSKNQTQFLDEMFSLGQKTGNKQDPQTVAQQMRYAKELDGSRRFKIEEFLSANQIKSYFSRKASKLRHGPIAQVRNAPPTDYEEVEDISAPDQDDEAAEEESTYQASKESIINECQRLFSLFIVL